MGCCHNGNECFCAKRKVDETSDMKIGVIIVGHRPSMIDDQ